MGILTESLIGKTQEERVDIKATGVLSDSIRATFTIGNLKVEVVDAERIPGGVAVYTRAWYQNNQIGFGDGTIDVERFRIINPPILIDDPAGEVVRSFTNADGVLKTRTLREAPRLAIARTLVSLIASILRSRGGETLTEFIVPNKVGTTVSTYYAESNDMYWYPGEQSTWAAARDATSATIYTGTESQVRTRWNSAGSLMQLMRPYMGFNTSSSPLTGQTISSATVDFYAIYLLNSQVDSNAYIRLVAPNLPTPGTPAAGDFDLIGTTSLATADIQNSSITTSAYNSFTVASPDSTINKNGLTEYSFRSLFDVNNTAPNKSSNNGMEIDFYTTDQTGTSTDPRLTVTHTGATSTARKHTLALMGVG